MAERPDLRKIAVDIREALETYPREALVDILTHVFQAYVVEGSPPLHPSQPERLPELEGLAFADLIQALQARLDVPELGLFDVSAGRVHVRVGGQLVPLVGGAPAGEAPAPPPAPGSPSAAPASSAQPASAPVPGVSVVEVPLGQMRPPPVARAGETPLARRGISVNGVAPRSGASGPAAAQAPPAASAAVAAQPASSPPQAPTGTRPAPGAADPEPGDDTTSKRFKLLEID